MVAGFQRFYLYSEILPTLKEWGFHLLQQIRVTDIELRGNSLEQTSLRLPILPKYILSLFYCMRERPSGGGTPLS
jgi:hypothetical protein